MHESKHTPRAHPSGWLLARTGTTVSPGCMGASYLGWLGDPARVSVAPGFKRVVDEGEGTGETLSVARGLVGSA